MSRPIWKGSIAFGLVNVPIQLETAVREKNVSFHLLSKDGSCRLRRKLYCPETGEEFDYGDTARGIEVSKDRYALVEDKELEALQPEKGRTIEIEQFVNMDELDPVYFDRPYFITPAEGGAKAYQLLHEAMKESKGLGLARFVMRDKEHLAAVRAVGHGLMLHTLFYKDEVLDLEEALPSTLGKTRPGAKELAVAKQLIDAMTAPLDLSKFKDDYREKVEELIERKRSGKKLVEVADDHADEPLPRTINLMEALKKSLAGKGSRNGTAAHRPRRKSA